MNTNWCRRYYWCDEQKVSEERSSLFVVSVHVHHKVCFMGIHSRRKWIYQVSFKEALKESSPDCNILIRLTRSTRSCPGFVMSFHWYIKASKIIYSIPVPEISVFAVFVSKIIIFDAIVYLCWWYYFSTRLFCRVDNTSPFHFSKVMLGLLNQNKKRNMTRMWIY